jgi:hypothetical protein
VFYSDRGLERILVDGTTDDLVPHTTMATPSDLVPRSLDRSSWVAQAEALWRGTNNTVGFNHMVTSAQDSAALVMETMKVRRSRRKAHDDDLVQWMNDHGVVGLSPGLHCILQVDGSAGAECTRRRPAGELQRLFPHYDQ